MYMHAKLASETPASPLNGVLLVTSIGACLQLPRALGRYILICMIALGAVGDTMNTSQFVNGWQRHSATVLIRPMASSYIGIGILIQSRSLRRHDRFVVIGLCWLYGSSEFPPPPAPSDVTAGPVGAACNSSALSRLHQHVSCLAAK